MKDKAIDRITISMSADMLDDRIVAELGELIAENPGNTSLFIQLHDSTGKKHVLLRSTTKRIDVKRSMIHFIEQTPALDYKIN